MKCAAPILASAGLNPGSMHRNTLGKRFQTYLWAASQLVDLKKLAYEGRLGNGSPFLLEHNGGSGFGSGRFSFADSDFIWMLWAFEARQ
jgi:hypothetical protein